MMHVWTWSLITVICFICRVHVQMFCPLGVMPYTDIGPVYGYIGVYIRIVIWVSTGQVKKKT
jgi:hypothetical protein